MSSDGARLGKLVPPISADFGRFRPTPSRHAMNAIRRRRDGNGGISRGTKRGVKKEWKGAERRWFGREERWRFEMGV